MMRLRPRKLFRLGFAAVVLAALLAVPARAANDDEEEKVFREPGIQYVEEGRPYIQWISAVLMAAACLFIAFKNPHRSHLD